MRSGQSGMEAVLEGVPQAFFIRTVPQTQRQHGKSNKITLPLHSTTSA